MLGDSGDRLADIFGLGKSKGPALYSLNLNYIPCRFYRNIDNLHPFNPFFLYFNQCLMNKLLYYSIE